MEKRKEGRKKKGRQEIITKWRREGQKGGGRRRIGGSDGREKKRRDFNAVFISS